MVVKKYVSFSYIARVSWKSTLFMFLLSSAVCFTYLVLEIREVAMDYLPIGTLGTAIAILLGFRNNSAYDRFWEARKVWGGVVNYSRTFARQILTMVSLQHTQGLKSQEDLRQFQTGLIYRHMAWVNALRLHLRKEDLSNPSCWWELAPYLDGDELMKINKVVNKPTQLLQKQGEELSFAMEAGFIEDFRHMQLDNTLTQLYNLQGAAERIKNTPLPRQYAFFTNLFTWIFVTLIPFGFIENFHWMTVPFSILLSWIFLTIEQVGKYTENPFDNVNNDVPMSALSRTIEIDLREQMGETDLPEPARPVRGILM